MSDQDIIDRAVQRHRNGAVITDGQARVIAAAWHGGQSSALCALATSGAILPDAIAEIDEEDHDLTPGARAELIALRHYVRLSGNRGPIADWHMLWGE